MVAVEYFTYKYKYIYKCLSDYLYPTGCLFSCGRK